MTDHPIHDPTARGDAVAERLRAYYEANRPTWWERRRRRWEYTSDDLMIGLANQAIYWTEKLTPKDVPVVESAPVTLSDVLRAQGQSDRGEITRADCKAVEDAYDARQAALSQATAKQER
jgi:hypothetical protein